MATMPPCACRVDGEDKQTFKDEEANNRQFSKAVIISGTFTGCDFFECEFHGTVRLADCYIKASWFRGTQVEMERCRFAING